MSISIKPFGQTKEGQQVNQYTLTNASGASISVLDWGAILTSIIVPDREGNMADVALGFNSMEKYGGKHGSMGDTIGRYGNRIGKGKFTLDGDLAARYWSVPEAAMAAGVKPGLLRSALDRRGRCGGWRWMWL